MKQIKIIFLTLGVLFLFVITTSCSSGMIAPSKGVTNKFFEERTGRQVSIANYDFSRLKQGYGLCLFSYDYQGTSGNKISGFKEQTLTGLRVWEYHFSDEGWDIKQISKSMLAWGYREASALFLAKSGYKVSVGLEFHRGRIVYAGRLIVDWPEYLGDGPKTEFHFDEDMKPWLDRFGDKVNGIKIDTVMMHAGF